jgi:hypothetical protein
MRLSRQRSKYLFDLFLQLCRRERLHDIVVHTELSRTADKFGVCTTSQHDEAGVGGRCIGAHRLQKAQTIEFGHVEIGDDEVRRLDSQFLEAVFSIRGF